MKFFEKLKNLSGNDSAKENSLKLENIRTGLRLAMREIPENASARQMLDIWKEAVRSDPENAQHLSREDEAFLEKMAG